MDDQAISEEAKGEHDAEQTQKILENSFMFNGVQVEVSFTRKELSWKHKDILHLVSIESIVGAKIGDGKSSKANLLTFTVFHREVLPTLEWKLRKTTFKSENEKDCETWVEKINLTVKEEVPTRPKRLLVFVNPMSGRQKAVQMYKKTVAPIFEIAEVTVDLIVTENGDHAPSVIEKYDLDTIDGIVSMGGDGTLARVANSLIKRTQKEADKDQSKIDEDYVQPKVPMAMLPGGTGNRCPLIWYTTMELEACALHIISGKSFEIETCAIYNNQNPAVYCALGPCFGALPGLFNKVEERRSWGLIRMIPAFASLFGQVTPVETEVQYIPVQEETPKLDAECPEWKTVEGDGIYCHIDAFMGDIAGKRLNNGELHLHLLKGTSGWNLLKYLGRMIRLRDTVDLDFLDTYKVSAFKLIYKNLGANLTNEIMTYDGEFIRLENPEVVCKLRKNTLKVLGRSYMDLDERNAVMESLKAKSKR